MTTPDEIADEGGQAVGRWLHRGSALVGALTGVAVGASGQLQAEIAGAVTAVVVGESLRTIGDQLERSVLSPREQERVGAAMLFAARRIRERQDAGDEPRDDGFFDEDIRGRSASDEFLEGVLRRAADAYEERKVPFLGSLFANLVFAKDVPVPEAHYFLRVADRLTFRQLSFLGLFQLPAYERDIDLIARALTELRGIDLSGISRGAEVELTGLANEGLFGIRQEDGRVVHPVGTFASGLTSDSVERLGLSPSGEALASLLSLDRLLTEDAEAALAELAGDSDWRSKAI
jgi:hypothetical protein